MVSLFGHVEIIRHLFAYDMTMAHPVSLQVQIAHNKYALSPPQQHQLICNLFFF